jgi:hypothetical protein
MTSLEAEWFSCKLVKCKVVQMLRFVYPIFSQCSYIHLTNRCEWLEPKDGGEMCGKCSIVLIGNVFRLVDRSG